MGCYKVDDLYVALLSQSVYASDALLKHSRIPWQVDVDYSGCNLKIQSGASRVGGKENAAFGIVREVVHHILPLFRWHSSMQILKDYAFLPQLLSHKSCHPLPLTEHHHLFSLLANNVADEVDTFVHLGVVSRLLVQDIAAVAYHPHL